MKEEGGEKEVGGKVKQTQLTSSTLCSELKTSCSLPSWLLFLDILGTCISRERGSSLQSQTLLQGSKFSASFTNIFLREGRRRWGK